MEQLRTADRKGLLPVSFVAMRAATAADALLPLLELLEPPSEADASKLDLVLTLLERIAESQIDIGQRLVAIESKLAGTRTTSR